jgi:O-antigen ligase
MRDSSRNHRGSGAAGLWWILVFPAFALLGGSSAIWTWGPGLAALGCAGILSSWTMRGQRPPAETHLIALFILSAFLLCRAFLSPSLPGAGHDAVLILIGILGCAAGRLLPEKECRYLIAGIWVVVIASFSSFVVQVVDVEWNLIYPARPPGFPAGLFAHYSLAAAFHIGTAGLFLAYSVGFPRWRIYAVPAVVLSATCVALSLSRSGVLALVISALFGGVLVIWRNSKRRWHLGVGVVVLLVGVSTTPLIITEVVRNLAPGRGIAVEHAFNDGGRTDFWNAAIQLTADRPLFGSGSNSFHWEAYRFLEPRRFAAAEPSRAHNEMLQVLVDYGVIAFTVLLLLLFVPIVRAMASFTLGSDSVRVWQALGLLGMMIQSNFESVFHSAPNVMIAAFLLGKITRPSEVEKPNGSYLIPSPSMVRRCNRLVKSLNRAKPFPQDKLCLSVINAQAYLAGKYSAKYDLVQSLLAINKPRWTREALVLAGHLNANDREAIGECAAEIMSKGSRELDALGLRRWQPLRSVSSTLIALALAALSSFVFFVGIKLSVDLKALWTPLYQPQRLAPSVVASSLLRVAEKNPFLGTDRRTLAAFLKSINSFKTFEGRQMLAKGYLPRLLSAIKTAETDPGVALQMASIAGWAGETETAFRFYSVAERVQAGHESVFMAHYFHAEYLSELAESAWLDHQFDSARRDASEAIFHLRESARLCPDPGNDYSGNRATLLSVCEEIVSSSPP